MQAITVAAILVLVLVMSRQRDRLVDVLSKPQVDVSQVVRDVLDRFVEQSKSTNETITGVYAPAPVPATPTMAEILAAVDGAEPARMMVDSDFDDSDPTDAYERPVRTNAAMLHPELDGENPFGIPGLNTAGPRFGTGDRIMVPRKDAPLTVEQILAAG